MSSKTLDENLLFVINEKFVDFDDLKDNGFDLRKTISKQKFNVYFDILHGSIYTNIFKEFWLNAFVVSSGHDDESIQSYVNDSPITITPSLIAQTIKCEEKGNCVEHYIFNNVYSTYLRLIYVNYDNLTNLATLLNSTRLIHDQMDRQQLYIDGLSHWLCKTKPDNKTYLLSFVWSNEVFLTTPLPSDVEGIFSFSAESYLVLLNGSIALIIRYKETNTFHILILSELGVRESWTKIFNVGPSLPCFKRLIRDGKKGRILFEKEDDRLAWFDLNTQMVEELDLSSEGMYCNILFHKENLHPIEGKNL